MPQISSTSPVARKTPRAPSRQADSGAALLDAIVALSLSALLIMIAAPLFSASSDRLIETEATRLSQALSLARSTAAARASTIAVIINVDENTASILELMSTDQPQTNALLAYDYLGINPAITLSITSAVFEDPGHPINAPISAKPPKDGRVVFFPDGSSTGGAIDVIAEDASAQVKIDWTTGAVTVGPIERIAP